MICEDCEQREEAVVRVDSAGDPYHVCSECDPGPGCRPIVVRDRYSNGLPMFWARCPQCGWQQLGTSETENGPREQARRHKEIKV